MINLKKINLPRLLISFVPLVLYWKGISGGFVWDDRTYFIENDILPNLKPWQLADIFFHPSNYWGEHLPLREFLYVLEYNLFGLSPPGYHIVSLALYIATGYLLYVFMSRFYSDLSLAKHSSSSAAYSHEAAASVVTLLFLIHPSHAETVAYISGQKDLLLALFSFLTMYLFWRYFNSRGYGRRYLFLGILTYYLSFISKLTAVSLILVIPLLWYISPEEYRPKWKRSLFSWSVINLPVLVWILISVKIFHYYTGISQLGDEGIPFRIINSIKMLGFYAFHTVKPYPLGFSYPFYYSMGLDSFFWIGIVTTIALSIPILLAQRKELFFASASYLIFLAPMLKLFGSFVYNALLYDRYLSISLLGVCILLERGFAFIYARGKWIKYISLLVLILAIMLLSIITVSYIPTFQSDIASTGNLYEKFPDMPWSSFNYVYSLIEGGRLDEAWEVTIREGTFAYPLWVRSYFIGWIYLQRGDIEQAIRTLSYSSFLAVDGGYYPFPSIPLGKALMAAGRYEEAEMEFRKALSSELYQPLEMYHARKELEKIRLRKSGIY